MLSSVSKLGQPKAVVARDMLQDINPLLQIQITQEFVSTSRCHYRWG
ncbi:hypothetical protein Q0N88_30370 [Bacillus thuringiensis]